MNIKHQQSNNQAGAALIMTVLVVGVLAVIVQSMVVLSVGRSRIANETESLVAVELASVNGLECGLSQSIYQQALAGGEEGTCRGEMVSLIETDYEDFDFEFSMGNADETCAQVYIRQDLINEYTIRSEGYLVCDNGAPVIGAFGQRRIVRLMAVSQTDDGDVSRSLIEAQ